MSDSSDVEVIEIDNEMDEFYENDIEEVIVGSSSEEEDPLESEKKPLLKEVTPQIKKVRRDEIYESYDYLQTTILDLDEIPSTKWRRLKTLNKGLLLCQDLMQQEVNLMIESEALLQENWQLKKRVEKLRRKKKRKTSTILTRRASGPVLGEPKSISPERKRASLDELKIKIDTEKEPTVKLCVEETKESIVNCSKNSKKKSKKRSGLTEEEKEFYLLEEKIEDLLNEVDALWNDVKDDEEEDDIKELLEISKYEMQGEVKVKNDDNVKFDFSKSKIEPLEDKQSGIENLLIRSFQITPSPSKGQLLEKKVNSETSITFQTSPRPDTTIQTLENEPTTSICERKPTRKESEFTEVINISDGSDSESSVVCIG